MRRNQVTRAIRNTLLALGVVLIIANAPAEACTPFSGLGNSGAVLANLNGVTNAYDQATGTFSYGCATTLESLNVTGNTADFTVDGTQPSPGCNGYTWSASNLGSSCNYTVTFAPQATGPLSITITPVLSNQVPTGEVYGAGAGYTVTSEQQIDPYNQLDFSLVLPSPQPTTSPFWAGNVALTFDSGSAVVTFTTPTLKYQTSGGVPATPLQPSPKLATFKTGSPGPVTLSFGQPTPGASPSPALAGGQLTLGLPESLLILSGGSIVI